ncbi:hypothetical protein [Kitasatospora sp. NPDC005751]|uniref:hypothetical protein n=1 Tax=Kitasatospora sp. NPDC005751 TaxID=3157064 RepID=UPI0033CA1711
MIEKCPVLSGEAEGSTHVPEDERLIDRSDYQRIYAILHALQLKAVDKDERPLWEILREHHEDYLHSDSPVPLDDLVGDRPSSKELQHALIIVERLMRGSTTVRAKPTVGVATVCATPGCPELTYTSLCLSCELKQS